MWKRLGLSHSHPTPRPPACVLMVSPVKTGKSTIISNLLLNEAFYGHEFFDDVFVISNTMRAITLVDQV